MSSEVKIDRELHAVNTIRVLAADVVQKSNSGHPGMPMGMAPIAHVLWTRLLRFNSSNPKWWNRDRFLLSNGHGCALQYILLHLSGYKLSLEDLKQFRQVDSKTPGHPEAGVTDGIEVTTGPLGQGIANGVGLALAETHLAALYNKPDFTLFDNYTYVFAGDGCMQEGVASEAASLAGHWGLGKLIVLYDDNKVTIDGHTSLSFTENVPERFRAYGWHTLDVADGDLDLNGLQKAIEEAKSVKDKPTLISIHTTIGFGSKKQGTEEVHGAPLGAEDTKAVKTKFGFNPAESFVVDPAVYELYHAASKRGAEAEANWNTLFAQYKLKYPKEAAELESRFAQQFPAGWKDRLPRWKTTDKPDATRNTSGIVLNAVANELPWIVGGSADLTPSNKTDLKKSHDYQKATPAGRYLRFGIREHGMAGIGNGIYAYGGFIPYTATFLNFLTYLFPSLRLSALSHFQQLFIMTHDSIGLGEDGPTHQPIETLALVRATPNSLVFRPADGNETTGCYIAALDIHRHGPSVFSLTRQNLPQLANSSVEKVALGAYTVYEQGDEKQLDLVYVATGSEVSLAIDAAKLQSDKKIRVISMPCDGLFDQQPVAYRRSLFPAGVPVISIENLSVYGWQRYSHAQIGMTTFGASGPIEGVFKKFGFTPAQVVESTKSHLQRLAQESKELGLKEIVGLLPTHSDIPIKHHFP